MKRIKERIVLLLALVRWLFIDVKNIFKINQSVFEIGNEITFTHKAKFTPKTKFINKRSDE